MIVDKVFPGTPTMTKVDPEVAAAKVRASLAREAERERRRALARRDEYQRWLDESRPMFGPSKPIPVRICECCDRVYQRRCCL